MASHRAQAPLPLLSFAADDVAANRVGQLSEAQRRSLRRAGGPPPWLGRARTVKGVPQFIRSLARNVTTLELGGLRCTVRAADALLFRKGVTYRLYHTVDRHGSPVLLSAEVVAVARPR